MKVFVPLLSVYSRRTKAFNLSFLLLGAEFSHKNIPVLQVMVNTVLQGGYAAAYLPEAYYEVRVFTFFYQAQDIVGV